MTWDHGISVWSVWDRKHNKETFRNRIWIKTFVSQKTKRKKKKIAPMPRFWNKSSIEAQNETQRRSGIEPEWTRTTSISFPLNHFFGFGFQYWSLRTVVQNPKSSSYFHSQRKESLVLTAFWYEWMKKKNDSQFVIRYWVCVWSINLMIIFLFGIHRWSMSMTDHRQTTDLYGFIRSFFGSIGAPIIPSSFRQYLQKHVQTHIF